MRKIQPWISYFKIQVTPEFEIFHFGQDVLLTIERCRVGFKAKLWIILTVLKERGEDGHFLKITPLYEPLRARKVDILHLKSAHSFTKCIIETQNVVNIFLTT